MATRRKHTTVISKTLLVKPKEIFIKELLDRIILGEELLKREMQKLEQLVKYYKYFSDWNDYNEELIKRAFNNQRSEYYNKYSNINQGIGIYDYIRGIDTNQLAYKVDLAKKKVENCVMTLKRLVEKLPLIEQDENIQDFQTKERVFYNRGFIVHGHNDMRKLEIARFVENDLKRKAIILHEQPNRGRTIIEKFEDYSKVDFAVALWTADDDGKSKNENDLKDRARQNVIFETGFFIGKLGRENIIVLYEDGVEIPSDYSGVIFIRFAENWKDDLRKEIDAIYQLEI
ncbi:MAG: nucleotide-binding protein [Bacteroidales bacterium]|nr:nucleotide-binding protein [Bacteroidales bacterium]